MPNVLADLVMPHYCCSCGNIGAVLCEHCKYDIITEPFESCIVCLRPVAATMQLCRDCRVPYTRAWCVGKREGGLEAAINRYKYESARAGVAPLVDLLDETIPHLSPEVRVVAVPTIARHVRMRGYDHMALVVACFASRRKLKVSHALERVGTDHQQGSTRQQRLVHARRAFRCHPVDAVPHLLIDDVYTTGATLHYAARALLEAGASEVWIAVLSRQLLEK